MKDGGVEVVAKNCTEASSPDVSLCKRVKSLRTGGWKRIFGVSTVAEEESVAVAEFLKLPLDDAGKERAHLQIWKLEKNIPKLTIPSDGAISARPAVNPSI